MFNLLVTFLGYTRLLQNQKQSKQIITNFKIMTKFSENTELQQSCITDVSGSYFDRVLIKLKRAYSKDETVSALSKKLSEVEIELGKSIAYIHELEHEKKQKSLKTGGEQWFEKYDKIKKRFDKMESQIKNDEVYLKAHNEIKKLNGEIKRLRNANSKLSNDNLLLKNQTSL